ncbi:transcription initiation factor IID, 18kD subunit-domain-containing protein [Phakopsora pachyrhizi]|uniref:Transcription initiation factor IID, 18kD subunit-domain-containing protein n=1 Tax=Phakopsora pachyrhizi TaxID=170000 RepID=A0AAV0BIZ2_PHAPC|nr:transcription initiation factor IID, 18kD subunit-domain-containing protein [Phakopsora pachyrhizi]CAH7686913.1 transcription initiation factor IID, 18kD subunit-domain-containing protein [Phakopsora pachyrhizi]
MTTSKPPSYSTEISQMLFVFGEVKKPDEQTVKYIEEVVRCQVAELVIQARVLAQRRGLRALTTDDLIFLIRHDRAKVNRLRTYLGWKDVRKKAREDGVDEKDIEALDPDPNGVSARLKSQKLKLKLPWDLSTIFTDVMVGNEENEDEEEDQDDKEAYEASEKRLREADELTQHMTREEYQHYSDCRQASFTYRKAKKFREFVGLSNYIEGSPKDEVVDVLGFLSYEMVRSLCERGLSVKQDYELARVDKDYETNPTDEMIHSSPSKRKRRSNNHESRDDLYDGSEAYKRPKPIGPFSSSTKNDLSNTSSMSCFTPSRTSFGDDNILNLNKAPSKETDDRQSEKREAQSNDSKPQEPKNKNPSKDEPNRSPLKVSEVEDAYALMQMGRVKSKMSAMRNFTGTFVRTKVSLI